MPDFSPDLERILFGTPFGKVFPPKAAPPPTAVDGRTVALRILKQYVGELTFYLPQGPSLPPRAIQIRDQAFHIEWPDFNTDTVFPSIAVLAAPADYDVIGLVSYVEEATRDKYKRGTVLQWQYEYREKIALEVRASERPERRCILSGLETAFSPTEQMSGVRFRMPGYFDELVCFTLLGRELIDEPDSVIGRRRAKLTLEMRFNVVALVNYVTLSPEVVTFVDTDDNNVPVDLSGDPNARQGPG